MFLLPWIGIKTTKGSFVPWLASQTDMLADDWMFFEE
ncbi:Thoeris anti-defense Tad2 family protein [Intestinibacter sp.]